MDTNTNTTNSLTTPVKPAENTLDTLAKNRGVIPVAFALIIILFFFSFCDFKCNSVKVASLSGINLVTGSHIKMEGGAGMLDSNPFGSLNENRLNQPDDKKQKVEPNIWAILAFLSAIGGAVVFYKKLKNEAFLGTAAGVIGVISLLLLRSAIKRKVEQQGGGMVQIEIDFLFAYWVSVLAFLVAGGISYLRMKQAKQIDTKTSGSPSEEKPVTPLHVNIITQENKSPD